ncbi:uncharacterized protein LOC122376314 isoform X2 [Amphibalanus amphitrite]|nr:uncharacterized protein LOC122376314 isoform X2 [Amphibalanus amphitrite]XP_043212057.1 uncharacterized protein LOC122376314 isoform X2 [Amphibalanus amphitrite]
MRVFVTHGDLARVFDCLNVGDLRRSVTTFFAMTQEVQLEIFDQAWGEWILLMDGDPINQERPRVRTAMPSALPKLAGPLIEFENPVAGSVLLMRDEPAPARSNEETGLSSCCTTEPVDSMSSTALEPPRDEPAPARSNEETGLSGSCTTEPVDSMSSTALEPPSAATFNDTELRPALLRKLRQDRANLTRSEWSEVVDLIYDYQTSASCSTHPTPTRYAELADLALQQWPGLMDGRSPRNALSYMKGKIIWRFKNKKRPRSVSSEAGPAKPNKQARKVDFEGYSAYVPPPPADDVQAHRNRLRSGTLDRQQHAALMAATFNDRRHHVVKLGTSVKRLLHMYPSLKVPDEIWLEMSRMEGSIEAPESKLAKYEAALCKLMDAAQQLTGCEDTDQEKIDALLEYLLVRSTDIFLEEGAAKSSCKSPCIQGGVLYVEGTEVATVTEETPTSTRLLLWAAMFPVFHQKIPTSSAQNALVAITEEVFGKPAGRALKNRSADRLRKLVALKL